MRPTTLFTLIFLAASSVTAAPGCGTSNDESSSIWSRVLDNVAGFSDESGLFQSALRFFSPGKKEENLVGKVYHIQFHATCKDSAKEIIEKIEKKQFKLREGRDWPDEFSWKGGLYLTSELEHAQAYARAFLPGRCKDLGGMVVIEFVFNPDVKDDRVLEASKKDEPAKGSAFRKEQELIAQAIKDKITGSNKPVPVQDAAFDTKVQSILGANSLAKFNAIQNVDFVIGYAEFTETQKKLILDAGAKYPGLPVLTEPIEQVVVITDAGMAQLQADEDDITDVPIQA